MTSGGQSGLPQEDFQGPGDTEIKSSNFYYLIQSAVTFAQHNHTPGPVNPKPADLSPSAAIFPGGREGTIREAVLRPSY